MWPRLPLRVFCHPELFFSQPVCLGYYEKSRDICVFWSDKLINNFNVFNNIKITLHYSVYTRTVGEKVRISNEAERVQSVTYSHIRSLSGLYTVVCLREGKRDTCLGPPFATLLCKVACLAFKGAQQPVVCLRGGERGTCLGPPLFGPPPWGITCINFPYFWWKTYYSLT